MGKIEDGQDKRKEQSLSNSTEATDAKKVADKKKDAPEEIKKKSLFKRSIGLKTRDKDSDDKKKDKQEEKKVKTTTDVKSADKEMSMIETSSWAQYLADKKKKEKEQKKMSKTTDAKKSSRQKKRCA